MIGKLNLRAQLLVVVGLIGVLLVAAGAWSAWQTRTNLIESRQLELRHVTDLAKRVVSNAQEQVASGAVPLADAQKAALSQIALMRYGKDGYFSVFDETLTILSHPDAKIVGRSMVGFKTPGGKAIYEDLLNNGHANGSGFYSYDYPRPGQAQAEPKLSFYSYDPNWKWEIVTGVYIDDIDAVFQTKLLEQLGVTAALLLTIIVLMEWFFRSKVLAPIASAVAACERVAAGDLSVAIQGHSHDEVGRMLDALSAMQTRLVATIEPIRDASNAIGVASREVASGNLDLSSRTEQQASSLEQTAASMEQLTSTVRQNADNIRQATQVVGSASQAAVDGAAIVSQVVQTMSEINQSSAKITDIIGVIDGIAFQTNLLALNAAVEAARAGEQGRGFAVVASEVRTLAQRSASAEKEIKALIDNSAAKVDAGAALVNQAGVAMNDIVDRVKRATDIMDEIAVASEEQTRGIAQISQAATQMEEITQQNAALVEEASNAAESLDAQAGNLAQVVGVFKLDGRVLAAPMETRGARARMAANTPFVAKRGRGAGAGVALGVAVTAKVIDAPRRVNKVVNASSGGGDGWEQF